MYTEQARPQKKVWPPPSIAGGEQSKGGVGEGRGRRVGGDGRQLDQCQIMSYGCRRTLSCCQATELS